MPPKKQQPLTPSQQALMTQLSRQQQSSLIGPLDQSRVSTAFQKISEKQGLSTPVSSISMASRIPQVPQAQEQQLEQSMQEESKEVINTEQQQSKFDKAFEKYIDSPAFKTNMNKVLQEAELYRQFQPYSKFKSNQPQATIQDYMSDYVLQFIEQKAPHVSKDFIELLYDKQRKIINSRKEKVQLDLTKDQWPTLISAYREDLNEKLKISIAPEIVEQIDIPLTQSQLEDKLDQTIKQSDDVELNNLLETTKYILEQPDMKTKLIDYINRSQLSSVQQSEFIANLAKKVYKHHIKPEMSDKEIIETTNESFDKLTKYDDIKHILDEIKGSMQTNPKAMQKQVQHKSNFGKSGKKNIDKIQQQILIDPKTGYQLRQFE